MDAEPTGSDPVDGCSAEPTGSDRVQERMGPVKARTVTCAVRVPKRLWK